MPKSLSSVLSLVLRAGVTVVLAVFVICAPPAAADPPRTMEGAAYQLMRSWMTQYDKDGFATAVDAGDLTTYRTRLLAVDLAVDPDLQPAEPGDPPPLALYDPVKKRIVFRKDPRTLSTGEKDAMGQTVWHEVTHGIEDENGDDFTNEDKLYQDRNTWYMTQVFTTGASRLDQLEKDVKAGASVKKLRALWTAFLSDVKDAENLPETRKYPPDLDLMKTWFGFRADPSAIRDLYLTDKAFAGKKWANLRKAIASVVDVGDDYQGGIVAYIFQRGDPGYVAGKTRGLVVTRVDLSAHTRWGTPTKNRYKTVGNTSKEMGTGMANTEAIIDVEGTNCAAGVARACRAGNHADWYLPSLEELWAIRWNEAKIGVFPAGTYWSSSEGAINPGSTHAFRAYAIAFSTATNDSPDGTKAATYGVRAVRTFK